MKTTIYLKLEETIDGTLVAFPLAPRFQQWTPARAAFAENLGLNPLGEPGVDVGSDLDAFAKRLADIADDRNAKLARPDLLTFRITRDDRPKVERKPRPLKGKRMLSVIESLRERICREHDRIFSPENRREITVEELFEYAPDGPFRWDGEPGDGNAWNCGDSDCEAQWHQSVQCVEMGRDEAGRKWFIVSEDSFAGDGDYQPCAGWDEREGDEPSPDVLHDLWFYLDGRSADHLAGWAKYYLHVAETGEDPLDSFFSVGGKGGKSLRKRAISAARNNLGYLKR